jgi:phospholipid/cholesterol/gamma-HCH transport system permease protein
MPESPLRIARPSTDTVELSLAGTLDVTSTGAAWREADAAVGAPGIRSVRIAAAGLEAVDGAGIGLLVHLRDLSAARGVAFEISGLPGRFQPLVDQFPPGSLPPPLKTGETRGFLEQVGRSSAGLVRDMVAQLGFTGELVTLLARAAWRPRQVRWSDMWRTVEHAGVNAFPIIALIGFLIGLILAFQSAVPMKQFGAEIFVADLVALSLLRELGPLMTAIVLAGRSGSAFAAEIGTMKVKEEIDALTTMGLSPMRFLVVPRTLAAILVTPLLTVFTNLFGLLGGLVVMLSLGFPPVTFVNQVRGAVHVADLGSGLFKSLAFGLLVAGIGCLRGLQTGNGASAVGESTTRAVVAALVLIILCDGLFSVVFYALGL